jgi:hypothetical protein
MIKMMTAYTEEVDEAEDGIAEILGQLDLGALKKNSVGLVTCHIDFTQTGFLAELCKKLPFDIIGMTTMASTNVYGLSMYALSLTVLTSDDVVFETAMTRPLDSGNYREGITAAYTEVSQKLPGDPSLILTLFPHIKDVSGSVLHKCFDDICTGIPFWGSLATNLDASYEPCPTFHNENVNENGLAMILMHGPADPQFVVVSLPARDIRKNRGQITDSDGCTLKTVNGIPPQQYFDKLGIIVLKESPVATPVMVYHEGSSEPVALAIYAVNDDGSFLCGGDMPTGAYVTIGEITTDGILSSASEGLDRVLQTGKKGGALFLPCIGRYLMLAPNSSGEFNLIREKVGQDTIIPFAAAYSGGEICPVRDEAGILRNRFHNFTFIACVF